MLYNIIYIALNNIYMKLIKHLANLFFLWTIPYMIVFMFYLLTLASFSYISCVTSNGWILVYAIYFIMIMIMYFSCVDSDQDLKLFKLN